MRAHAGWVLALSLVLGCGSRGGDDRRPATVDARPVDGAADAPASDAPAPDAPAPDAPAPDGAPPDAPAPDVSREPLPRRAGALVAFGESWRYLDEGAPPAGWQAPGFDDRQWRDGPGKLGYGDGDEATVLRYGPDPARKPMSSYFRKAFTVPAGMPVEQLRLSLICDDGAIVYLNGAEVFRYNMPRRAADGSTPALFADEAHPPVRAVIPREALREGANVMAVQVHQHRADSPDLAFDLELEAVQAAPRVVRGPYLQRGTATGAVLRWRTDRPAGTEVRIWTDDLAGARTIADTRPVVEHEVAIGGLTAATKHHYAIGAPQLHMAGVDDEHFFVTPPRPGTAAPTRVWVLGDSGTGNVHAAGVRDAYAGLRDGRHTDVWLMLGDNAYQSGTDEEYQAGVFDMYPRFLRSVFLWPTIGNHDTAQLHTIDSFPYLDIFTLPAAGEAGGLPSGTERYYSFDHGRVHFVCLDSMSSGIAEVATGALPNAASSAMMRWLDADLAASKRDWLIVYFHHPPYTKGSHDSDVELVEQAMRTIVLPVLERHGVDLVLTGHSHSYERSYLLHGHYGNSTTLAPSMLLDATSGRPSEGRSYRKRAIPGLGAVYVVAGSGGQVTPAPLNHPAMAYSAAQLASLVIDVEGDRMEVRMLRETGAVEDAFAIVKER